MSRISLDQLDEFNNVIETIENDNLIKWDADAENFVPLQLPSGLVFGNNFQYEVSETYVSTSSTVFQTYLTMVTSVIPAGTYRVSPEIFWRSVSTSTFIQMDVLVDGVDVFPIKYTNSSHRNDTDMRDVAYGVTYVTFTEDATHTILLRYRRDGTNGSINVYGGLLEFWRVA